jgi:oxygen-independent coproporphyrinogen-3 oxidase
MEHYTSSGRPEISSIFFGGGTPTILPVPFIEQILEKCHKQFNVCPDSEISIEANPATIRLGQLKKIRAAGFNRISIGVQSFHEHELKLLDRVHSVDEVYLTVNRARDAGFENLSLDLMFALPGQSSAEWEDNLARAIALQPNHISTYNLTIEPGTAFHKLQSRGELAMPADDFQLQLYKKTIKILKASGFEHYEISNFCKPGMECRHNLNYWRNGDYFGLGAGASSYLGNTRSRNHGSAEKYIRETMLKGAAVEFSEQPGILTSMGETIMLGLRLMRGINIRQFEKRFQTSFTKTYGKAIASLLKNKLILMNDKRVSLSRKGLYLADSVILEFIH